MPLDGEGFKEAPCSILSSEKKEKSRSECELSATGYRMCEMNEKKNVVIPRNQGAGTWIATNNISQIIL